MPDMTTIASAVSSLKAAGDIAKGLMDLRDAAAHQTKVIELQRLILDAQTSALAAQSEQFSLLEQFRQLEKKIREADDWTNERSRYALTDFGGGTFAYSLRQEAKQGEPSHLVCATCYQAGRKSILQHLHQSYTGQNIYHCQTCAKDVALGVRSEPRNTVARGSDDWR